MEIDWGKLEVFRWVVVAISLSASISYIAVRDKQITLNADLSALNKATIDELKSNLLSRSVIDKHHDRLIDINARKIDRNADEIRSNISP